MADTEVHLVGGGGFSPTTIAIVKLLQAALEHPVFSPELLRQPSEAETGSQSEETATGMAKKMVDRMIAQVWRLSRSAQASGVSQGFLFLPLSCVILRCCRCMSGLPTSKALGKSGDDGPCCSLEPTRRTPAWMTLPMRMKLQGIRAG